MSMAFEDSTDREEQDQRRVQQLMPVVKRLARQIRTRSGGRAELEDLIAAGSLGLVMALKRGVEDDEAFKVYAAQRIRGAMIDYMRQRDPLSRADRQNLRKIYAARDELRNKLGREPWSKEVASHAGLELTKYDETRVSAQRCQPVGIVNSLLPPGGDFHAVCLAADNGENPEELLDRQRSWERLMDTTERLEERSRYAIERYYLEGASLREIAATLGVTESRVSQIVRGGLTRLRDLTAVRDE